jgi:hypothetical protein
MEYQIEAETAKPTQLTEAQFREVVKDLGDLAYKVDSKSAFDSLTIIATAFGALLDIYADPNPENDKGMCDDKQAFRQIFADIIARKI